MIRSSVIFFSPIFPPSNNLVLNIEYSHSRGDESVSLKEKKNISCSSDSYFIKASTFDSPKKEKRLPRKWRSKNYNKDVKTTLQVISVAVKHNDGFLLFFKRRLQTPPLSPLRSRYPAASPPPASTPPTPTCPPLRSATTRSTPSPWIARSTWPSCRRTSAASPLIVGGILSLLIHSQGLVVFRDARDTLRICKNLRSEGNAHPYAS